MQDNERFHRLMQIAEQDEIYIVWKKSYQESSEKFARYMRWCPKKIRSFLYGYAECGRMMMQRMVNLACKCMEFPDERQ